MIFFRPIIWMISGLVLLAGSDSFGQKTANELSAPDLLVLPVVNYTEVGEANTLLLPRLYQQLDQRGVSYLTSDELRPLLRKHRIRSRGWVGFEAAQTLERETQARYILLGSWDVFRTEINPEIALSLRVLDLEHLSIVSSSSVGLTGADFTKVLGLGTIDDIAAIADLVMERAFEEVFPIPEFRDPRLSSRGCFQIALVPFDNYSGTPNAGDIVTNIVLSRLWASGYFVVEPGFVRELGLALEIVNRGGVDLQSASSILDSLNACRVVTGTVEKFSTASGTPLQTSPDFAVGIRVMSPQDGKLYMMEDLQGAGDDGEGLFQSGRVNGLVSVANRVLQDFLDELVKNNREDILHGNRRP